MSPVLRVSEPVVLFIAALAATSSLPDMRGARLARALTCCYGFFEPDAADEYLYRTLDDRWVVTRVRGRLFTYEQVFYDNLAAILAIGAEH